MKSHNIKDVQYVIGIDYGSDSVRAILVNAANGEELAVSVFEYPRWKKGLYCNPAGNQFRQHPLDYLEGLEFTVREVLKQCPGAAEQVKAISIDTTGSTPVAVDEHGTPLALLPEFAENPNAMFVLWKDHTAIKEADEINTLARSWGGTDFTKYSGGIYSSEWFWAKMLHVIREDAEVAGAAFSWMEHCDWLPAMLTGNNQPQHYKRSRCAAGHKAMWHSDWAGFPPAEFLTLLDERLVVIRQNMCDETLTSDVAAGCLSDAWAQRLGLTTSTLVGVGALDAHFGAVGGEIKPYYLSKVIGTSTCDMLIAPETEIKDVLVRGISGQVDGSIVPGMMGMEAGQSAFGDIYAWYKNLLMWPLMNIFPDITDPVKHKQLVDEYASRMLLELTRFAEKIPAGESSVMALDWMNGRRTPDADQSLKGVIAGLTLGSDAPRIFRALVEATAFGSRAIVERFREEGIPIRGVIALGGIAKKSPFVMQILANVLNMPIQVAASEQTCALGAAMFAAVVAGIHRDIAHAQFVMGKGFEKTYVPQSGEVAVYRKLYVGYQELGKDLTGLKIQTNC
ncbi:MAG: ribulokinase [Paludibacter sp.]|nr:ribulokinase [Paludibacter sp.]